MYIETVYILNTYNFVKYFSVKIKKPISPYYMANRTKKKYNEDIISLFFKCVRKPRHIYIYLKTLRIVFVFSL